MNQRLGFLVVMAAVTACGFGAPKDDGWVEVKRDAGMRPDASIEEGDAGEDEDAGFDDDAGFEGDDGGADNDGGIGLTLVGDGKIGVEHSVDGDVVSGPRVVGFTWRVGARVVSTTAHYTPVSADNGQPLRCTVTADDGRSVVIGPIIVTYQAPVSSGDLPAQTLVRRVSVVSLDFAARVSVPGDPALAGGSWSVPSGSLPTGLTRDAGVVSGVPMVTRDASVVLRFTNSGGFVEVSCRVVIVYAPTSERLLAGWWELSEASRLKQSVAGTGASPSAAGDPVGYAIDQGPNGLHLSAASDPQRLSWGPGYVLERSGVNTGLSRSTVPMAKAVSAFSVGMVFESVTPLRGDSTVLFHVSTGTSQGLHRFAARMNPAGGLQVGGRRLDSDSVYLIEGASVPAGRHLAFFTIDYANNTASVSLDGLGRVSAPFGSGGMPTSNTDALLTTIGGPTFSYDTNQDLKIYEVVALASTEVTELAAYLEAKYPNTAAPTTVAGSSTIMVQGGTGDLAVPLASYFAGTRLTYSLVSNPGGLSLVNGKLLIPTNVRRNKSVVVVRASNPNGDVDRTLSVSVGARTGLAVPDFELPSSQPALDALLDQMVANNVRILRTDLRWENVEATSGTYTWGRHTLLRDRALAKGVKVLLTIHRTPAWARLPGVTQAGGPSTPSAFANFAVQALNYYGASRLAGIELWTEPNSVGSGASWQSDRPIQELVDMHAAAYAALKAVNPAVKVCSASLRPVAAPGSSTQRPAKETLQAMYMATDGLAGKTDAVGFYPFWHEADSTWDNTEPSSGPNILRREVRPAMVTAGDGAKEVWFTEIGAPTAGTGTNVTQAAQASGFLDAWMESTTSAGASFNMYMFYTWKNRSSDETVPGSGTTQGPADGYFGAYLSDGLTAKPVVEVFRSILVGQSP